MPAPVRARIGEVAPLSRPAVLVSPWKPRNRRASVSMCLTDEQYIRTSPQSGCDNAAENPLTNPSMAISGRVIHSLATYVYGLRKLPVRAVDILTSTEYSTQGWCIFHTTYFRTLSRCRVRTYGGMDTLHTYVTYCTYLEPSGPGRRSRRFLEPSKRPSKVNAMQGKATYVTYSTIRTLVGRAS